MEELGSTLYRLTWKEWTTESGRSIPALRGWPHRTSDSGCGGWRSPNASDGEGGPLDMIRAQLEGLNPQLKLRDQVLLTGWPTPTANDATGSQHTYSRGDHTKPAFKLPGAAKLAGWQTPKCPSGGGREKRTTPGGGLRKLEDQVLLTVMALPDGSQYGIRATGCCVEVLAVPSGAQLSPEHSRWLQGIPATWDDCAAMAMLSLRRRRKRSSVPTSQGELEL